MIHDYMLNLFKARPELTFHLTCYHNETIHHRKEDKDGKVTVSTETKRVNTWHERKNFMFVSSRDISGLFRLNSEAINENPGKYFVKLHLKLDVKRSGDGTENDYTMQRDYFFNTNRWRDQYMETSESTSLSGFNAYNLVAVGGEIPTYVNFGFYVLFTLLTVVELYKIYVNSFCISQNYTIVKEISSKRNLNANEFNSIFGGYTPEIKIRDQVLLRFDDPSQLPAQTVDFKIPDESEVNEARTNDNEPFIKNQKQMFY